jgi:hypothetical protein
VAILKHKSVEYKIEYAINIPVEEGCLDWFFLAKFSWIKKQGKKEVLQTFYRISNKKMIWLLEKLDSC